MRKHRVALIAATVVAIVAVTVPLSATSIGSSSQQETTVWKAPPPGPPSASDQRAMMLERAQFTAYTTAVLANEATALRALAAAQAAQQAAAQAAAARAAQSSSTASSGPSAPVATTAPATGGSGAEGCAPPSEAVQEARAEAAGVPCAWVPTAICEEQGYDDANYGFFGIQAWGGFGGYPSAGSAPLSVQLGWESAHGQGPPDAPGQCHGY